MLLLHMPSKKSKNLGEQNEVFLKAFLAKHFCEKTGLPGASKDMQRISTLHFGKGSTVPQWNHAYETMLQIKDYQGLRNNFEKAKTSYKADIFINDVSYSIKFNNAAKPAIVNHTNRAGFLRVCNRVGSDIAELDAIIDEYWNLRMKGTITEDVSNSEKNSPFAKHKKYLTPILLYFIFEGTGSRDSAFPANKMLSFTDPFDPSTYRILSKQQAIDDLWDHLVFSMRSKKGMPSKFEPLKHKELVPWTRRFPTNEPRGSLHVRVEAH